MKVSRIRINRSYEGRNILLTVLEIDFSFLLKMYKKNLPVKCKSTSIYYKNSLKKTIKDNDRKDRKVEVDCSTNKTIVRFTLSMDVT